MRRMDIASKCHETANSLPIRLASYENFPASPGAIFISGVGRSAGHVDFGPVNQTNTAILLPGCRIGFVPSLAPRSRNTAPTLANGFVFRRSTPFSSILYSLNWVRLVFSPIAFQLASLRHLLVIGFCVWTPFIRNGPLRADSLPATHLEGC